MKKRKPDREWGWGEWLRQRGSMCKVPELGKNLHLWRLLKTRMAATQLIKTRFMAELGNELDQIMVGHTGQTKEFRFYCYCNENSLRDFEQIFFKPFEGVFISWSLSKKIFSNKFSILYRCVHAQPLHYRKWYEPVKVYSFQGPEQPTDGCYHLVIADW